MPCILKARVDSQPEAKRSEDLWPHNLPVPLYELTRSWLEAAERDEHAIGGGDFSAFIYRWIVLNAWATNASGEDEDSKWIRLLAANHGVDERFHRLFCPGRADAVALARFAEHWPILHGYKARKALDAQGINHDRWLDAYRGMRSDEQVAELEERFRDTMNERGVPLFGPRCAFDHRAAGEPVPLDLPHTLDALYRVRNNLFHGEKGAANYIDRLIVRDAGAVLKPLVLSLTR